MPLFLGTHVGYGLRVPWEFVDNFCDMLSHWLTCSGYYILDLCCINIILKSPSNYTYKAHIYVWMDVYAYVFEGIYSVHYVV